MTLVCDTVKHAIADNAFNVHENTCTRKLDMASRILYSQNTEFFSLNVNI